jgi:competence protein ComEA
MTAQERQALWFLLALTLLGAGVRVVRSRDDRSGITADSAGLAHQLAAVDSAVDGRIRPRPKGRKRAPDRGSQSSGASAAGSLDISAIPRGASRGSLNATAMPVSGPVDLDVAGQAEIEALPWVGPALARRILANRESCGAFGSIDGLQRVPGVGAVIAERLSERVTFSGSPRHPSTVPSQCFPTRSSMRDGTRNSRP